MAQFGEFCEHGRPVTEATDAIRPTLLMVGRGEAMDAALKVALDRHGLHVAESTSDIKTAVRTIAPDVVLLVGDAANDGGRAVLDALAADAVTNVVPVIVLGPAEKLDGRLTAFRAGAVAVVPKTASADQIATRIATVAREIAERGEARPDELGEATFDELVTMVASELRSGILSVGRQRGGGTEPMRIVLGAGRPVADAVEEFVRKLRPLVSRAEPLTYELHASAGGPVGLFEVETAGRGDLTILQGLRIILVDSDASRADTLSQELRARGSVVAVADPSARGIERARGLDPQVVIVDAAGMDGTGFEVVRAIRRDVRLRWAAMLVAPWAEIWPENAATPDLSELALRLAPLVMHDRELRVRALEEQKFDARLEITGPSRLLRVLASLPGPYHVHVQSRKASVEIDVAEGLVVGAKATRAAGDALEGTRALAALLAMASARVTIERRPNPSTANVMAPIEEALARASQEAAPIPVSQPPPAMTNSGNPLSRLPKRSPFPTASEVGRNMFEDDTDASGPLRAPVGSVRAQSNLPKADMSSRDLRWSESESGVGPPPPVPPPAPVPAVPPVPPPHRESGAQPLPQGVFSTGRATGTKIPAAPGGKPAVRPPSAAASAFGDRTTSPMVTPANPLRRDEATVRVQGEQVAKALEDAHLPPPPPFVPPPFVPPPRAPSSAGSERAPSAAHPPARKQTLVMGALQGAATRTPPPSRPPIATPGAILPPRSPTLTMGTPEGESRPPSEEPPPKSPETVSASMDSDPSGDPLFADGKKAMESGEHHSDRPLDAHTRATTKDLRSVDLRSQELTDPSTKPFVPDRDAMKEPVGAPPVPDSALIAPPSRPRVPTKPDEPASAPIGSFAMSPPPPAPTQTKPARLDPTPLGVISMPTPPSGVTTTSASGAPPASPSGSGRTAAWMLVGLGAISLLGVGGWVAYARRDQLSAMLGLAPPQLTVTTLDGTGVDLVLADAGELALVVATAPVDAGVTSDAWIDPLDAWIDPVDAFVATAPPAPDAWTAPPPSGEASVEDLLAQASHADAATAESLYRRVLQLDPSEHHAAHSLGEILMRHHQAADAVPLFEIVTRRRPGQAGNWIDLGDARRDAGDQDGARAAWRTALDHDPENATAHERLGE